MGERQKRYDKAHMKTISARVPLPMYHDFRAACRRNGETMHAYIRRAARAAIIAEFLPKHDLKH